MSQATTPPLRRRAADDLRLEVYVFAEQRAVPESYFHVSINDAAVDWWQQGANYPDVITQAADEAGGHAFATDYFGPSENFAVAYAFDEGALRTASDAVDWIQTIARQGVPLNQQVASVIVDHVAEPAGADPVDFVNCPTCFEGWDPNDFDATTATADLVVKVLDPLREFEALFDFAVLTRMTSSLDAIEMTVDPRFVLNPDLSGESHFVDQQRTAQQVFECGFGRQMDRAPRRLVLADGREIELPSQEWFRDNPLTEFEFIQDLRRENAQIVEQLGESGEGEVVSDRTGDFLAMVDLHNADVRKLLRGCSGCHAGGSGTAGAGALLALLLLRRRRST